MTFYRMTRIIANQKQKNTEEIVDGLDEDTLTKEFQGFTVRKRCYHIIPLFKMFMIQMLSGDACRETIIRGISTGLLPITTSPRTSAYCNARNRLPEEPVRNLVRITGSSLQERSRERWLFKGRPVKVVDGSSVQMADTESNQSEYPQHKGQKKGCGYPLMGIGIMMELESGAILDVETDEGTGHEHRMFQRMWRSLETGDIVLADAYYGSYAEMAELKKMGVDGVFRKGTRKFDLSNATRIGNSEWLYTLERPSNPGNWIDRDELPDTLTVRVIRVEVKIKGYRSKDFLIYTTLLDSEQYPADTLAELYLRRWEIELRLRDIKTVMGLEMLRCKTPSRCRKELYMGLLAYNLIRAFMLEVSLQYKVQISRISFKGTVHRIREYIGGSIYACDPALASQLLLTHTSWDLVAEQGNKVDPRKLKRRQKGYKLLVRPREEERKLLLNGNIT